MAAALGKKKKLKIKGDFAGSVAEDALLSAAGAFKSKKKLKTAESFGSGDAGVAFGTLTVGDGKKPTWSYQLNNSLDAVQKLPAGATATETHLVKFKAKGSKAITKEVVITVAGNNDAPTLTKNGGGAVAVSFKEGQAGVITTLTASDVDHGAHLTYSLAGGADAARFTINGATGALSFKAIPNFESPTDSGANNSYAVNVRVSDGSLTDTQLVTVNVTNVNEAPVITSNGGGPAATVNVAENTTAVTTATATDPDAGASKIFSITGGADAGKFQINSTTGALSFVSAPNFEAPTDSGANNTYEVIVRVSDGALTDTQTITVTVTNVSEGPNTAPLFSSHGGEQSVGLNVQENTTLVTTVSAFDWEDDPITFSLLEEDDWTYFDLDPITGTLSFIAPPDFEDVGHEALYFVTVLASDGSLSASQDFAISVDDVNENGRTEIDLASLSAAQGFDISPDAFDDYMGSSVALGDINGDGFADVLVGAFAGDDGGSGAGEIYVLFGKAGTFGSSVGGRQVVDLTNDNPGTDGFGSADGFILQGAIAGDNLGYVAAGDVNLDGSVDVIGGAVGHDADNKGAAFVYFGRTSGFGSIDANGRAFVDVANDSAGDGFAAADGFLATGNTANEQTGSAVSSAGDINGDGIGDIIVGARYADDGGTNSGAAYVIFGKTGGFGTTGGDGRASLSLATLAAADGFVVAADAAFNGVGLRERVSGAGDLNGDGIDDLLFGNINAGAGAGEAYVIFGKSGTFGKAISGRQVVDLTNDEVGDGFAAGDGFIIRGGGTGYSTDLAGYSVSRAGDMNGDGFVDIIVAAPLGDEPGLANTGEAYIVFGKATGFGTSVDSAGRAVLTLSTLTPSQGFLIRGEGVADKLGTSVFEAGDFNGDGFTSSWLHPMQATTANVSWCSASPRASARSAATAAP